MDQGSGQGVPRIENGAYTEYVSISIRGTTQPWRLRRIFKMNSRIFQTLTSDEKNQPVSEWNYFLLIPVQWSE